MLVLRGFRGFKSYKLSDLATVNLIVGKNNCGKTSVLEAVELLVTNGHPAAFSEAARRRGELTSTPYRPGRAVDISHLFFGHGYQPGAHFALSSDDGKSELSATILSLDEVGEAADRWDTRRRTMVRLAELDAEEATDPAFGLRIVSSAEKEAAVYPITENGTVLDESWGRSMRNGASGSPVRFLALESVAAERMGDAWDKVITERREDEIAADLRILVPEIDSIHFLTHSRLSRGGILVGHQDGGPRLPIGSYGDGLRRLLALRLALVGAADGFLLIDEIDAGLHWTVMEDVWRLLVEVARKSNVQIFATTHSYDCIRGLGSLVRSRPHLAEEVSIQKVHGSLQQAVSFRGQQIRIAAEQEIEVR